MTPPRSWKWVMDDLLRTLVLIRLGQMLGSDSRAARAVHDLVEAVFSIVR
jgi:hypothetical protein